MLDIIMVATEPFGTWGPGPNPEPIGGWARIFDAIANDPRAVATIFAAFFGFLSGTLIKYGLDRRAYFLRRQTDRRMLKTALRAELVGLDVKIRAIVGAIEELFQKNPTKTVFGDQYSIATMALPPRRVWAAHIDRIGELNGADSESLVLVHFAFDSHDLAIETLRQRMGDQGVPRESLQERLDRLKDVRKALVKVGGPLYEQTKTTPPT